MYTFVWQYEWAIHICRTFVFANFVYSSWIPKRSVNCLRTQRIIIVVCCDGSGFNFNSRSPNHQQYFSLEKNHIGRYFLPLICSVPLLFHRVAHVIYEETILPQYIITKRSELLFLPWWATNDDASSLLIIQLISHTNSWSAIREKMDIYI